MDFTPWNKVHLNERGKADGIGLGRGLQRRIVDGMP
jgi:hypothetical protein